MNATMEALKVAVSSAETPVSRMHIIVASVSNKKRIGTDVPRLSIWGLPRPIYSTRGRNTVSRRDSKCLLLLCCVLYGVVGNM